MVFILGVEVGRHLLASILIEPHVLIYYKAETMPNSSDRHI
jgi:hypothetical protein